MEEPYRRIHAKHRKAVYQTDWHLLNRIRKLISLLGILVLAHTLAMVYFEHLAWRQALWLTMTTLTTVGYGDLSAKTAAGQIATVGLLYITGITMVTFIISDYIDYRFLKREKIRAGRWKWNMIDHILIINAPMHNTEQYFERLVRQIRAHQGYTNTPIQVLTDQFPDGLPIELSELGIVHYHGTPDNYGDLSAVNVHVAKHILILARDESAALSDSNTFDVLHRLMELKLSQRCVVESVRDENRARLSKLEPKSILRPVRTYPEIIITAMLAPGSEKVLEDLITHEIDHPQRYPVFIEDLTWADIVCALMHRDQGTAMAYVTEDEEIILHPPANKRVHAIALIVIVKTENEPSAEDIQASLNHYKKRKLEWEKHEKELESTTEEDARLRTRIAEARPYSAPSKDSGKH